MDGTHFYLIYHSSSSLWQLHMDLAKVFGDHMKDRIASWIDGDGECYNLEATVDEDAAYNAAYTNLQNKPRTQIYKKIVKSKIRETDIHFTNFWTKYIFAIYMTHLGDETGEHLMDHIQVEVLQNTRNNLAASLLLVPGCYFLHWISSIRTFYRLTWVNSLRLLIWAAVTFQIQIFV